MAEKKQPRDKNGHFASDNGAVAKEAKKGKSTKASVSSEGKGISLEKAYENKVRELINKDEDIAELKCIIESNDEVIKGLMNELEEQKEKANYFEKKAKAYLRTIEYQNAYVSALRNGWNFLLSKLSIFKKLRYIRTIDDMHEQLCEQRKNVIRSMKNWE